MSFIHMKAVNIRIAESSQDAHSPNSQNDFLTKAVIIIAAVEEVRQSSIPGCVLVEAGIEKIYWNGVTGPSMHPIAPGAQMDAAAFENDGDHRLDQLQ
jgi:hypothetical protein